MTRLLVSVRDAKEAHAALRGGADLIDAKEPNKGSLGAASPGDWLRIVETVNSQTPVSAALGELLDDDLTSRVKQLGEFGFRFAKVGLAGCAHVSDWQQRWRAFKHSLPTNTEAVAVAYADWQRANSPAPRDVLQFAINNPCGAFLIDTFEKSSGGLLQLLDLEEVSAIVRTANCNSLISVLAGSLNAASIDSVLQCAPSYIAVRGAVCSGHRTMSLDESLVHELATMISERTSDRTNVA